MNSLIQARVDSKVKEDAENIIELAGAEEEEE